MLAEIGVVLVVAVDETVVAEGDALVMASHK